MLQSLLPDANVVPSGEKQTDFIEEPQTNLFNSCILIFYHLQLINTAPFKFIPLMSTLSNSEPLKLERTKLAPMSDVSFILKS
jgi:hypothetical protein